LPNGYARGIGLGVYRFGVPGSVTTWSAFVVLVLLLVLSGLFISAYVHRRRSREDPASLTAEPEDRPLPAVIANPLRLAPGSRERITAVCTDLGWREPLWLETTVEDPGTGQAQAAVEQGADVVMAGGGDGTVRSVAQALAGTGVVMALLPAGTGNLLARTLGTPMDVPAAVRVALTGDDRPVDVGWVRVDGAPDERLFLVMAGTGFDATVMEATPEALKVRMGTLAYVISGLRAMRGRRIRVSLTFDDGAPLRRRTRTILVGNSGTLLGGLVLMPRATIDDGLLDVVSIAPNGIVGWVAVAIRIITRRRRGHQRVEHWQAHSIVITAELPQPSQLDGDPIGDTRELRIRVQQGALVIRVPDVEPPDPPPVLP